MASFNTGREEKGTTLDRGASNTDLLLHPELLSKGFIQLVLQEKKISSGDDESRDSLTELYLRHVIPLPQRTLPNSRWGKRMERSRARQSPVGVQSRGSVNDHNRKRPLIVFDGSSSNTGPTRLKKPEVATVSGVTDRLKPPPSMNLSNPVRKLSSTATQPVSSSSTPSSSSITPVSGPGSPHSSPTGNGGLSAPSVVKLKREADGSGELKSPDMKKRIQHVKWP